MEKLVCLIGWLIAVVLATIFGKDTLLLGIIAFHVVQLVYAIDMEEVSRKWK